MEAITQIEVTTISNIVVGIPRKDNPDWSVVGIPCSSNPSRQVITNTFIFTSLTDAKTFASRCMNRHTTVVVTDVTDERDEVLFNSKSFSKIADAKKAVKSL